MRHAGNDGGVYRSEDRGINWVHCNNGLQVSEFEYIAHNVGVSRWLVGGTQDNGTNRWTGPPTWEHVGDADGGDCGVNRNNPQVVFHTRQWWALFRSDTGGGFGTWANVTPPRPAGEGLGKRVRLDGIFDFTLNERSECLRFREWWNGQEEPI